MGMIYYVIAFAAGLWITLQTTLNSQLAKGLGGGPVTAASGFVTQAGGYGCHADRTCRHAFRRSALCTFSAVTALSTFAIVQDLSYLQDYHVFNCS